MAIEYGTLVRIIGRDGNHLDYQSRVVDGNEPPTGQRIRRPTMNKDVLNHHGLPKGLYIRNMKDRKCPQLYVYLNQSSPDVVRAYFDLSKHDFFEAYIAAIDVIIATKGIKRNSETHKAMLATATEFQRYHGLVKQSEKVVVQSWKLQ